MKVNSNWCFKFKVGFCLPWSFLAPQTGILTYKVFGVVPNNFTVEWFALVTKSFWCLVFMQKIQFLQCGLHEAMIISWITKTARGWNVTLWHFTPTFIQDTLIWLFRVSISSGKVFFSEDAAKFMPDSLYVMFLWHFWSLPNVEIWNENKFPFLIYCEPLDIAFKCRMQFSHTSIPLSSTTSRPFIWISSVLSFYKSGHWQAVPAPFQIVSDLGYLWLLKKDLNFISNLE